MTQFVIVTVMSSISILGQILHHNGLLLQYSMFCKENAIYYKLALLEKLIHFIQIA